MLIQSIPNHTDNLTHRKRSKDRSDSKSFDVAEEEEGESGCHGEAGHVEGDLDAGVWNFQDVGHLTWEQVCRDDRESAAVRKGDSETENQVAYDEVDDLVSDAHRKSCESRFVYIEHFAEGEAYNEAEKVGRDKFFP